MPNVTRTFRVFVSSTFNDLIQERNALQKHVFPKLTELCMQHGCRFQAIDLRWGIREESSLDQQTMKICFEEIKRCQEITPRPNFIVLLGDRYGWRPLPFEIPASEFERIEQHIPHDDKQLLRKWYKRDDNAVPPLYYLQQRTGEFTDYPKWNPIERKLHCVLRKGLAEVKIPEHKRAKYTASATEQEIMKGLEAPSAYKHVFCFLRKIQGLPENSSVADFVDLDEAGSFDRNARRQLNELKDKLRRILQGNVYEYKAKWVRDGTTIDHTSKLCNDVYTALARIILKEIKRIEEADSLDKEIADHKFFGKERSSFFVGRENALQKISDYVKSANPQPFAIFGKSGSGKSALMAQAVEYVHSNTTTTVVFRFVGATPDSSNCRALLESLCRQISRCYAEEESATPTNYSELIQEFPKRLALATAKKPLIVFIDALDQLSDSDHARSLSWLPGRLPEHVHVIVSCLPDESLSALQKRLPAENLLELGPMPLEEGQELLNLWFADAHRTLQPHQLNKVLSKFKQCPLPLYLKLAFEASQRWRSDTEKTGLSSDVPSLIRDLLMRLSSESNHGQIMVSRSLGLMAAAKNGLTEDELFDLLSQDEELLQDFISRAYHEPPEKRLPVIVWSRLHFDLKPYLTERTAYGTTLIAFYHRQFGETVSQEFLVGENKKRRHKALALYFGQQPLWIGKEVGKTANLRKVSELPFQLTFSQMWPELESTLCDLQFATAKCLGGMLFDLIRDCDQAIKANALQSIVQMRRALLLAVPSLSSRPKLAAQTLYNQLIWIDGLDSLLRAKLEAASSWLDEQGFWIRAEASLPGTKHGEKRYVPFEIESSIQALSSDKNAVAIGSWDGKVEIRNSSSGEPIETRYLNASRIAGIALCDAYSSLAYIDIKGEVCAENSPGYLKGRKGETRLVYHTANCIVTVRVDDSLVAWYPNRNECIVLKRGVPAPLAVLRVSQDSRKVIFVAGFGEQVIGVASNEETGWVTWTLPYCGPPVIDANIDPEGKHILLASMDRTLKVLNAKTGEQLAQLFYEHLPNHIVRGRPEKCALGFGESEDRAFVATKTGHIACWHWKKNEVIKLENYRTVQEANILVLFDVISTRGQLFLSTRNYGKVFTTQCLDIPITKHESAVSGCVITASGKVVSIGESDYTVRWFSAEGLQPLGHHHCNAPTVVTQRGDRDEVAIGNKDGRVWNQTPNAKVDPRDVLMAFAETVTSLFYENEDSLIAAGKSGRVLRIHPFDEKVSVLLYSTGFRKQEKILPAGQHGLFWSLREDQLGDGSHNVLSLVKNAVEEEVVMSSREGKFDVAVSSDGTTVCVAGRSVKILRRSGCKWTAIYHRDIPVTHVSFLGNDFIAVVLFGAPWIEVWRVAEGLPTVTAIDLPSEVSCLSTRGLRIVAGCRSGDLISLRLRGQLQDSTNKIQLSVEK